MCGLKLTVRDRRIKSETLILPKPQNVLRVPHLDLVAEAAGVEPLQTNVGLALEPRVVHLRRFLARVVVHGLRLGREHRRTPSAPPEAPPKRDAQPLMTVPSHPASSRLKHR